MAKPTSVESIRTGLSSNSLKQAVIDKLMYTRGKLPENATANDYYMALSYAVRDRMQARWVKSVRKYGARDIKIACYLSAEYLLGPHLGKNLLNLGITEASRVAMAEFDVDLNDLLEIEEEPGLGNGGLGRLAACYLDSLATLERPSIGYGIRYEFGIFDQAIRDGEQVEMADLWLAPGNPWEIYKPEKQYHVWFGGHTEKYHDDFGNLRVRWIPREDVIGVAYDTPILGYRVNTCNTLRLWKAEASESFDFDAFNTGDYYQAVEDKVHSETITKVLYPNDEPEAGKRLRLIQQYFFVSCSLQDMVRIQIDLGIPMEEFADKFVAQLNDTHPSIGVPELMRILIDVQGMGWDTAWDITRRTFAYTNHTLLPEALETWSLKLFQDLLPRHTEIIFEINHRFMEEVRRDHPGNFGLLSSLSIIAEGEKKRVRMANLATIGSFAVNGVAAMHSALLKKSVMKDFYAIAPYKFHNVTNGVTPRRFLLLSNPGLAELIEEKIDNNWPIHLDSLRKLEPFADKKSFQKRWREVKLNNKKVLAQHILHTTGTEIDPTWMFDVLIKRIHEYKRQHLQVLHIIARYIQIKEGLYKDLPPRAYIFAGKAAPGYFMAKRIIRLIHGVGNMVNNDPAVNDKMKVVFIPDYNVKNAQRIYPAADLSEQISLAGKEASGTGNMKFAMNGALTIGTLDGANVEIREEVGPENFFLFGMNVEQVNQLRTNGYNPQEIIDSNPLLQNALKLIEYGHFSGGDSEVFKPIVDHLRQTDTYFLLADFSEYFASQDKVNKAWKDQDKWTRMSILNTARMGKFSSDRSILDYCEKIWKVDRHPVEGI